MSAPSRETFLQKSDQDLIITVQDQNKNPVTGLTVTATLIDDTGTPVPYLNNLALADIGAGQYKGRVVNLFNPPVAYDYTLNVLITDGVNTRDVFIPSQVVVDTGR